MLSIMHIINTHIYNSTHYNKAYILGVIEVMQPI